MVSIPRNTLKDFIITPNENRIAKEFFREFTTSKAVSKKLYPNHTSKGVGAVGSVFGRWNEEGFFEEGKAKIFVKKEYKIKKKKFYKKLIWEKSKIKFIKKKRKRIGFYRKVIGYKLNTDFYIKYLLALGIKLDKEDKKQLEILLNNKRIREFIHYWNKQLKPKREKKKQNYLFEENLLEKITTFIRCIYYYREFDFCIHVLNNFEVRKYFKIAQIVRDFKFPKDDKSHINRDLMYLRHRLYSKIDIIFDREPAVRLKTSSIQIENPADKEEWKILFYLGYGKKNSKESDDEELLFI